MPGRSKSIVQENNNATTNTIAGVMQARHLTTSRAKMGRRTRRRKNLSYGEPLLVEAENGTTVGTELTSARLCRPSVETVERDVVGEIRASEHQLFRACSDKREALPEEALPAARVAASLLTLLLHRRRRCGRTNGVSLPRSPSHIAHCLHRMPRSLTVYAAAYRLLYRGCVPRCPWVRMQT